MDRLLLTHRPLLLDCLLVAQDTPAEGPPQWPTLMIFGAIGLMFYFLLIRPERHKQSTHKSMLENLKKNDRVVTAGGIRGVIANVHRDADEVTVTVDESTGTKLRMTLASITRVESAEAKSETKK